MECRVKPLSEQLQDQFCGAREVLQFHAGLVVVWQSFLPDSEDQLTTELCRPHTAISLDDNRLDSRHVCEYHIHNK